MLKSKNSVQLCTTIAIANLLNYTAGFRRVERNEQKSTAKDGTATSFSTRLLAVGWRVCTRACSMAVKRTDQ